MEADGDTLSPQFIAVNPAIYWTIGCNGHLHLIGQGSAEKLGLPPHLPTAKDYVALIHPADLAAVTTATQRARKDQRIFDIECRLRLHDAYRWMHVRGQFDPDRRRWIGAVQDIHARRQAEDALRIANERLALAVDGNAAWAWDFDIRTGRFWFSDGWQVVLGYGPSEIGYDLSDLGMLVHPEDQSAVDRAFRAHLAGRTSAIEMDYRLRRKDGTWVWVNDRGRVIERDEAGKPLRAIGTRTDVTARKAIEAQARASEAYLKTLLDNITDGVIAVTPDGRRGFYNKAFAKLFAEDVTGEPWDDLTRMLSVFDVVDATGRAIPDGQRPLVRILRGETLEDVEVTAVARKTGRTRHLVYNGQPVRGPDGSVEMAVLSVRDVSERRTAQTALVASEERLRLATESAGMGTWDYDLLTGQGVWSASACRLLGQPVETHQTWAETAWRSSVHPDDIERVLANAAASRAARRSYVIDFRIVRRDDGETRSVQAFGAYLYDDAGIPGRHVGVFFDISDRKTAEDGLRDNEARLQTILESLEEGVLAFAPDNPDRSFINSAFRRMLAPDPSATIIASMNEAFRAFALIDADGNALLPDERPISRLLRGERLDRLPVHASFPDGREIDVVCRGEPIFDEQGKVKLAVLVVRDITEQRKAEAELATLQQELIHVSRVSAMGTMAGSLAHELNQPLAAVSNYAAAARMILAKAGAPVERAREALAHVAEEALRAGQIVNRLRRFITKGEVERQPASLASVVREALAIAHSDAAAKGTPVKLKLDPKADAIIVDRVQLQQVIFNLVRNAVEAMAGGPDGELTIASRAAGDNIELLIADRGPGLPPEVAAHLFEPFVTTKEAGMGIGLPICQSIMRAHGGDIRAETRPRGGAVFILTLPRPATEPAVE
jgi:two-component system sensor kinase FixL